MSEQCDQGTWVMAKGPGLWPEPSQHIPSCLPRVGTEVCSTADPQTTAPYTYRGSTTAPGPQGVVSSEKR